MRDRRQPSAGSKSVIQHPTAVSIDPSAARGSRTEPRAAPFQSLCRSPFVLAIVGALVTPAFAAADEATFPRGSGMYFNLLKMVPLLIVYLGWVRTCFWVDQDSRK